MSADALFLAHSAPRRGAPAQEYANHVAGVVARAKANAEAMAVYARDGRALIDAVIGGAAFHDLGKLDPEIQRAFRKGRGARLPWDHIDAGVAHLQANGAIMAAWLARGHHAPGLPSKPGHAVKNGGRNLRGRRWDEEAPEAHEEQIERSDHLLPAMLAAHEAALGGAAPILGKPTHGLQMRLALSCLVDADHTDAAVFDTGCERPLSEPTRWPERLAALDAYVAGLEDRGGERDALRRAFYRACREGGPEAPLVACEGPVGIGKTTAVTAFLLRRAIATKSRRLIIVAPYTAILSQTADVLRKALVLEDERDRADRIVVEHHHRADFSDVSSRDLATLWSAPIILTTAVQFFETLAANTPAQLRKLHALPGSVVFLDEAHAALPARLWPQNWRWLRELSEDWSCSFVFASGSLARFWELESIVGDDRMKLAELVPSELTEPLHSAETRRVAYSSCGRFDGPDHLAKAISTTPGPRLLILNTVQSAAVMARHMKTAGHDLLHLSTALCPRDRDAILKQVIDRLSICENQDWTLVATSLVEAGVDLSFRTAFRERFSTASLIQTGGRANRHGSAETAIAHDFILSFTQGLAKNPAAAASAEVLSELFRKQRLEGAIDPAELVTLAIKMEMRRESKRRDDLMFAERSGNYPEVARLGRVIETDTRLVVVDAALRAQLEAREQVSPRDLLARSVQLWSNKIAALGLEPILNRQDVYWWPHPYDGEFLGYMEGALRIGEIAKGEALIV